MKIQNWKGWSGGKNNNTIINNEMWGGEGNDEMNGGSGNDSMWGEAGNDEITGGSGSDLFVFTNNCGTDTISDFDPSQDRLYFLGLTGLGDLDVTTAGENTFITYEDTIAILEGIELTEREVWSRI